MKQWLDYIPLVLFFAVFKLKGIFPATEVLIASSVCLYAWLWFSESRLEKSHHIVLAMTLVFGGMTLYFHDVTFLKWKASIIDWCIAAAFLSTHIIPGELAIQRMLGQAVQLPVPVWKRLNVAWAVFFASLGSVSLYVAFHMDTNTWVNFKVFGTFGLTFLFAVLQMLYISRHIVPEDQQLPSEHHLPSNERESKD